MTTRTVFVKGFAVISALAVAFLLGRVSVIQNVKLETAALQKSADTFIDFWRACYEEQKARADLFEALFIKSREESSK